MSSKTLILKNIRILDYSRILVGSLASMMLADLGAEVIKIESKLGDETRSWGPPFIKDEKNKNNNKKYKSSYFSSLNRNKKSISIDLKHQLSFDINKRLIENSDIIIENFPFGKFDEFNLSYNNVKEINDKIIYTSVNGFGHKGDVSNLKAPAFDFIMQAYTGIMGITGEEPNAYRVGFPICDILTSQQVYSSILLALYYRIIYNKGQHIKTSLVENSLFLNPTIVSNYLNCNINSGLKGNDHPNISPYTIFKYNNNKSVALGVALDNQFEKLKEVLNIKDKKQEFITNELRIKNRDKLKTEIQYKIYKFVEDYGYEKLDSLFKLNKIPFSNINTMKDVFNDRHINDLNIVKETIDFDLESGKKFKYLKNPVEYNYIGHKDFTVPPSLGEHTEDILLNVCKYNKDEINNLKELKCVQ